MNIIPRKHWDGAPMVIPGPAGSDFIVLECEVRDGSRKGRTVYLFLDGEESDKVMMELRSFAIRRRSRPMSDNLEDTSGPGS